MKFQEPSELILARCRAFVGGDFKFIYESYHPESSFRRIFPSQDDYIRYGCSNLIHNFRIRECRILREEIAGDAARVIWYMDMSFQGGQSRTLELSILRRMEGEWRYLGGRKRDRHEFPSEIEDVGWDDFRGEGEILL